MANANPTEYSLIRRVAGWIGAIAINRRYSVNEQSLKLKHHELTSRRLLHAQEMDFNDICTTL